MKAELQPGVTRQRRILVNDSRAISFMGEEARVYATPEMVNDVEYACRDLIVEYCEPGEDSVGVHVSLEHLGATPMGCWVDITVTVTAVSGRRVTCAAEARDALDLVGKGEHTRLVVETERTIQRVRQKRQRLAAL